jgi:hypothetical protein
MMALPVVFPVDESRCGLADRFLEALAGAELGLTRWRQVDPLAGARVAARACPPGADEEAAEADDAHLFTTLERFRDQVEHGLNGPFRLLLAQAGRLAHLHHQILLIHAASVSRLVQAEAVEFSA